MTTLAAPAPRWPPRPTRFRSSGSSIRHPEVRAKRQASKDERHSTRPVLRDAAKRPLPRMTAVACGGALRSGGRLLWKAACLRGAPSALAARLPSEFGSAQDRDPLIHPRMNRVLAPFEPNQSIHVRKAAKVRRYRLFQNPVPAADGIPDARRPAAARAGNPQALERDRPLPPTARASRRPDQIRAAWRPALRQRQ